MGRGKTDWLKKYKYLFELITLFNNAVAEILINVEHFFKIVFKYFLPTYLLTLNSTDLIKELLNVIHKIKELLF